MLVRKACEAAGGTLIRLDDDHVACVIPRKVKIELEWYGEKEKVRELDKAVVFCGDTDLDYDDWDEVLRLWDGIVVGRAGGKVAVGYAAWGEYARWIEADGAVRGLLRRMLR